MASDEQLRKELINELQKVEQERLERERFWIEHALALLLRVARYLLTRIGTHGA